MNIYLAGKISKNDWRHGIVPGLRETLIAGDKEPTEWPTEVAFEVENVKHIYVGPFFMCCDHGCGHGRNEHGLGMELRGCMDALAVWGPKVHDMPWRARHEVFRRCGQAIRACDLFYVWLDQRDAYGTLVEIGIARMMSKKICIASPRSFDTDDFWFAVQASDRTITSENPATGLATVIREIDGDRRLRSAMGLM